LSLCNQLTLYITRIP